MPSRADAPWKTMGELVKYIKANPGKVRWGRTIGLGHPLQLLTYSLLKKDDLKVIEVPFKGAADAITALLGGHIDVAFGASVTATAGHAEAGRLRILAIHNRNAIGQHARRADLRRAGPRSGRHARSTTPSSCPRARPMRSSPSSMTRSSRPSRRPRMVEYAKKNGFELYYGSEADVLR